MAARFTNRRKPLCAAVMLAIGGLSLGGAQAAEYEWGEVDVTWDNTLNYGVTMRAEERDEDYIGKANVNGGSIGPADFRTYRIMRDLPGRFSVNVDDGNLAYDDGDLISNQVSWTSELSLSYENYGAFFRGYAFYDFESADRDFEDEAYHQLVTDVRLLDAYVYSDFTVNDRPATVRLGSQVVSWGESTFIQQGINVINAVDLTRLRSAGSEVKEAFLPHNMLYGQISLTDNLTLEGLVMLEFDEIVVDPAGSYFSTSDFAGYGGEYVMLGFGALDDDLLADGSYPPGHFPRARDDYASDAGQFGLALRWFLPDLNFSEIGFYYLNYHSRLPLISGNAVLTSESSSGSYFLEYPEDIHLFGVSLNTTLPGGIALGSELSYRSNLPVQVDDVELLFAGLTPLNALIPAPALRFQSQLGQYERGDYIQGYERQEVSQFQFTLTKLFGPNNPVGADDVAAVAEVGFTNFWDLPDKDVLRFNGPGTDTSGSADIDSGLLTNPITQTDGFADSFSWGYRLLLRATYQSAFGTSWNVSPSIAFAHDVNGTTPGPGGNFIDGRKTTTLGVSGDYLQRWSVGLSYNIYSGGGEFNLLNDRDFAAFNVKYSF